MTAAEATTARALDKKRVNSFILMIRCKGRWIGIEE